MSAHARLASRTRSLGRRKDILKTCNRTRETLLPDRLIDFVIEIIGNRSVPIGNRSSDRIGANPSAGNVGVNIFCIANESRVSRTFDLSLFDSLRSAGERNSQAADDFIKAPGADNNPRDARGGCDQSVTGKSNQRDDTAR